MWSMWRCVRRTCTVAWSGSAAPRRRIPVPASRTRTVPSSATTETHAVLPPYRTVSGPALAIDPLEPQIPTFTGVDAPDDLAGDGGCRGSRALAVQLGWGDRRPPDDHE